MRKSFILLTAMIALTPAVAMATNYECDTIEVTSWRKGRLIAGNESLNGIHSVIHFNDETGDFEVAVDKNPNSPMSPIPFRIVRKVQPDKGNKPIVEVYAIYDGEDRDYNAASNFIIREVDTNEPVFLLYIASLHEISTGKCHVYDKEITTVQHHR